MFFPLRDDDRALSKPAIVTHVLFWLNIAVFVYQFLNPDFTYGFSAIPAEITGGVDFVEPVVVGEGDESFQIPHAPGPSPIFLTLITSMFMHGGFMHIAGNMLYLWIFGDNVEHRFGSRRFLVFYLVSGVIGSLAHVLFDSGSMIPSLGASGAISGVMGAYLVLFPRNKVTCLFLLFIVSLPAFAVIGGWAVTQVLGGIGSIAVTTQSGGVAYLAHIGGFIAGIALALVEKRRMPAEPDSVLYRYHRDDPTSRRLW